MAQGRRVGLVIAAVLLTLPVAAATERVANLLLDGLLGGDSVDPASSTPIGGGASATPRPVLRPGNTAPTVRITVPTAGATFTVGGVYPLNGSATDGEDGPLPPNALSWTVVTHRSHRAQLFSGPVTGSSTSILAPAPGNLAAATDSWLEIRLTATDSAGLGTTVSQRFDPAKVPVTVTTVPTGRLVSVDGRTVPDGTTITSWAGYPLQLGVPGQYDVEGREYAFGTWSDGGAASHPYVTPASASTVTASLRAGPSGLSGVTIRQSSPTSATISWVPPTDPGASTVIGYSVRRAGTDRAGRSGSGSATVDATRRSFTMTGLVAGRTYRLTVNPFNAYAAGPSTTVPLTMGVNRADAPRAVTDR